MPDYRVLVQSEDARFPVLAWKGSADSADEATECAESEYRAEHPSAGKLVTAVTRA